MVDASNFNPGHWYCLAKSRAMLQISAFLLEGFLLALLPLHILMTQMISEAGLSD